MYRAAVRTPPRQAWRSLCSQSFQTAPGRFASTSAPAYKPRTWKGSALRWGLAFGAVYYYNTSSVFADEATGVQSTAAPSAFTESDMPTVHSATEQKRKQLKPAPEERAKPDEKSSPTPETQPGTEPQNAVVAAGSPEALEEEAGQEGAFNPETGEINWDCPCLGGMAHGPCGEEFKAAFSCFVYSTEEPKGMDCIDKFQGMQECFRKYPDIYGAELSDDGEEATNDLGQVPRDEPRGAPAPTATKDDRSGTDNLPEIRPLENKGVPKKWEDATDADRKDAKAEQPGVVAEEEKENKVEESGEK
ncbi:intermembrane space import and assembly protein 40 [Metarhizium album ARSEF 1941]|uniref:Mitochondrial intermembrane space import and assembly protein 40 n=1 Tax=Metarhizium album (strain ARSEF 1941) TaxID=1081103 RepID=A0A0B2WM51_METAS|nr:intermembrane space import and assembly protein 40 [Metarhizium album ARSEF 1941]KHN95028.1 intermembrane space import and assembly protein 40 [Metarhizium album ARSEF 1941]